MEPAPGRRSLALVAGVIAASVVAVTVVLLFVPHLQVRPGYTMIGAHLYASENESLFGSGNGWLNYTYEGVLFGFHLWCQAGPAAGIVCGNATGPDGIPHPYSFSDGPPTVGPPPWQTWVAPDAHEAVQYQQGGLVHLLVAA